MKDTEFYKLIDLANVGGGFIPANENAQELLEQSKKGEILSFLEVTDRDLKFHRCYMSLLTFIWGYLPVKFQKAVPNKNFYKWLKHLKGEYDILFEFKDGTKLVEYESIAFGNMSQKRFEIYIKNQLPWIYENVIGEFFKDEMYKGIVDTIEQEYIKFMDKLT